MRQEYWLAENGEVRCLDDKCPTECDLECPIYLQTMAVPYLQNEHFKEAAEYLEKAVEIEPTFGEAWNNLALCYGSLGRHQDAFVAYQKSYQLRPRPKCLYGMALASKHIGNYTQAAEYANLYVQRYGVNDQIERLIAELGEKKMKDDMQIYGSLYLLLLDQSTRQTGYMEMAKMEARFPEAGIPLGQYFQGKDPTRAKRYFKTAADAGIAEGQWGYSQILKHNYVLDLTDAQDQEYLKYCLAAAEGGCPDAANEMGNICHRKGYYEESTYWYGMAYALEHPQGINGLRGITNEWAQQGIEKNFTPHLEGFSEDRYKTSLLLYKMYNQTLTVEDMDEMMTLTMAGENLAGFMLAKIMEQHKADDIAYSIYNALAFEKHPYALRCYADMLLNGIGTPKDTNAAFRFYEMSARGGNAVAMYAMGQKAVKDNDLLRAAAWFGMAYSRGMDMAGDWLVKIKENR